MSQVQPSGEEGEGVMELAKAAFHLRGLEFPLTKDELVQSAQEMHVPQEVVDLLGEVPDQVYNDLPELISSLRHKI